MLSNAQTFKGHGEITKQTRGKALKEARRNSTRAALADEEVNALLKAGFRIHDKVRGIFVHI